MCVCVCVCPILWVCSAARPAFLQLLSVTLFFYFLSCSHSLPHNGFSVMIVVFCSALTHEALRLTMGAHVCCIMMKLLSQCSERQHWRDFGQHLERETNRLDIIKEPVRAFLHLNSQICWRNYQHADPTDIHWKRRWRPLWRWYCDKHKH